MVPKLILSFDDNHAMPAPLQSPASTQSHAIDNRVFAG
jgi:hypothetical protein